MTHVETIDGVGVRIEDPNLGAGGQGSAMKGVLVADPTIPAVVKIQPADAATLERAQALVALTLPRRNPFLAAPLAVETAGGKLRHVAPFAAGKDLLKDKPRPFPQKIEIAHHLACQWTSLEEAGVAHGDVAPSNVAVADNGAAWLIDFDNAALPGAPNPTMAGQHMMLAPELRKGETTPTIESDRFAWAVLFNMILLGRHPADGLAKIPADLDRAMSAGRWPERNRKSTKGETPIEALGPDLPHLFDAAFAKDPAARPSADAWRRALLEALATLQIHGCGQAFIAPPGEAACPWCGAKARTADAPFTLIVAPIKGRRQGTQIRDGQTVLLGRATLPGLPQTVSAHHLEITRQGRQVLLRHRGRNPTLIHLGGQWFRLAETWIEAGQTLQLRLAEADVRLHVDA